MGYNTNFNGELKFKNELTASEINLLKSFLGQDRRDIGFEEDKKVYETDDEYWYHIDLELNDDFTGIRWNGAEKTYDMDKIINFLTKQMKQKYPNFELIGTLSAQGEERDDRYNIVMVNGKAEIKEFEIIEVGENEPNYEKAYNILMEYFDSLPDEEKFDIDKRLKEVGL